MNDNRRTGRAWMCSVLASCLLVSWGCDAHAPTQPRFSSRASSTSSDVMVTSTSPNNAPQDTTLDVAVNGSGFDRGSVAQWARNGAPVSTVRTNSTQFVNPKQLIANITISLVADTGLYDVMVTASTGKKGIGTELFTIKPHGPKPPEPANPEIAYSGTYQDNSLMVMNASGTNQTAVFVGTVRPIYAAWAPGGGSLAFGYLGAYHLWRMDVQVINGVPTGADAISLSADSSTGFPDWSPDGSVLAVQGPTAGRPENCCILLVPAGGGPPTVAYTAPVGRTVTSPAWSPDGSQIAFSDLSGTTSRRVSIVTLATGAVRVLVPDGVLCCGNPAITLEWSPDGREIAFAGTLSNRNTTWRLLVADVATGAVQDLGIYGRSPSYSPDGTRLVYESLKAAGIYVLNRATGVTTQLSSTGGYPDWKK